MPATASSRAPTIATSWPASGACRSSAFPTARGLAYPDIIEAALDRQDPRAVDHRHQPDRLVSQSRRRCSQALDTLDFLVVQDGFHPTPTTELADLVLPAAIWGEKEGTYTNSERRVSKVNRAVDAAGRGALRLRHLSRARRARSAAATSCFPAGRRPRDAFEEWKRVSAGRLCDYSGMTYDAIEQHGGMQWPYPAGATGPGEHAAALHRRRSSRPTTARAQADSD